MTLEKLPWKMTVCKAAALSEIPLEADFIFFAKTDEELSLVCKTADAPSCAAREDGWRIFRVQGVLDFSLTGVLSGLSGVLAENKIGLFAISTFNTDYILVKEENFERALNVLRQSGYAVKE